MITGFHGTTKLESIVRDGCLYAPFLVGGGYNENVVTFLKEKYDTIVAKLAELSKKRIEDTLVDIELRRGVKINQDRLTQEELADLVEYCGCQGQDFIKEYMEFKEAKRIYFVWLVKSIQPAKNYAGENGHVLECNLPDEIVRPQIIPGECILVPWKVDLEYVTRVHTPSLNLQLMNVDRKKLLKALKARKIEVVPY